MQRQDVARLCSVMTEIVKKIEPSCYQNVIHVEKTILSLFYFIVVSFSKTVRSPSIHLAFFQSIDLQAAQRKAC